MNRTLEVSAASARLSLSEPWAYLCRSRQPAADIVPLLIIEQISKTGSFIPAPSPPPFPSSFQTGTVKAQTAVMLCPVVFIQPSYNSYLSSSSQLLFSTLILGPENETKCPTMNKTTALFSVPHGNLITWYEHFIFSKLLLHQSPFFWHWNEKCGLCTELNPRLHSAPLTMCVSQHLGPRWIARPAIEVVFCWAVLSSQAFRKASDQETTVLALACTPGTLHPTRAPLNWPWVAGVIKGGWGGGEAGVGGWGCVCLWKETFC